MKRIIITIAIIVSAMSAASAQDRTAGASFTKDGKTFVQQKSARASRPSDDRATAYTWKDSKGNEYPIYLHTYTRGENAGKTTCYVLRTSKKTGKEYKYYLPDGIAIAEQILKESK